MKIILFLCILFFVGFSYAQENKKPVIQRAREHRFELVQKQDELLELLLQIPFEQRQYIFPLLSAKKSVPKKIKTHPEVLVWKGKRPTRIADIFKDDKELIEYLPEQFYYFLAPEMWAPEAQLSAEFNPNQILQNLMQTSENELSIMPENLTNVYDGLNILQKEVQKENKQPKFPLYFETWISSFPEETKEQIKEKTGMQAKEFGKKIDIISQTYRLYQKQKIPPNSPEQKMVQEYWSLIPFIFQKTGFRDALNEKIYQD